MTGFQLYERLKGTIAPEAAEALAGAFEELALEVRNAVTKEDFHELKEIVADLGAAQKRTEQRVEELAEAQKRTEQRVEELAAALKQTEQSLSKKIDDLDRRFGTLGSRWGEDAEGAFRQGLLEHVRELGYTVEHYHGYDPEGFINWTPRSYDLDILTSNGKVIATEIKSFTTAGDVTEFWRSAELFVKQTGREVSRRILVAVTIQKSALKRAEELGVTVSTHFPGLSES